MGGMKVRVRRCELCPSEAAVFCPSDAAFLCWSCDAKIHEANFLVARHVRQSISTTGHPLSTDADSSCSTISSSSAAARRPRQLNYFKAEGIFVNWCGKLGIQADLPLLQMACKALKVCLDGWTVLPFRVCLAASMWLALNLTLHKSSKVLKRLEHISGVPAKLILAAASKLERALRKHHNPLDLEEGWAES